MIKNTRDVMDPSPQPNETEMQEKNTLEYIKPDRSLHAFDKLSRNAALAALMLLAIVSIRNAQLPSGQTLLTAAQTILDPEWDETLGKIDFVGHFFPETVSVFFETDVEKYRLITPCINERLVHSWSENEPYLGYDSSDDSIVRAVGDGQVMSLAHGTEEENIVRVRQEDGLEVLYYNLATLSIQEGDEVKQGQAIGSALAEKETAIEVRRNGISVNPTAWMHEAETTP